MRIITKKNVFAFITITLAHNTFAHESGDPVMSWVALDHMEIRNTEHGNAYSLDAQAWAGKDLHKFWIKADAKYSDGTTEELEIQALYSRAIAPYWDLQIGLREDVKPHPDRTWAVIGIHGLAPYFFELDAALFIGDAGDTAGRVSAEYELLITQQLVLAPEITLNFFGQNDAQRSSGSGLADAKAGLRLRYEIRREFAPYLGVNWTRSLGNTADFLRVAGEDTSTNQWVAGFSAWW